MEAKQTYRISVSTIEKFRRYMVGASDYDTYKSVIESILGKRSQNDKTSIGTSFYSIIETYKQIQTPPHKRMYDGIRFSKKLCAPAIEYKKQHPNLIHEISLSKLYQTEYFDLKIYARIDSIEGSIIRDTKLRFSPFDFMADYYPSYQWRFYLDMFGLSTFYYDIFELIDYKRIDREGNVIASDIVAHDPHLCHAYTDMKSDIDILVNDFAKFIDTNHLTLLLKKQ